MPSCLNKGSIPKVLASSGIIGTTCLPIDLSFVIMVRSLTYAIVVETSLSPVPFKSSSKIEISGIFSFLDLSTLVGTGPPKASLCFLMYLYSLELFVNS